VRDRKLALIVALQKNRGELSAEALKKLLASASSGNSGHHFSPAITRRQSPPSPLPRFPTLATDERRLWLGARDPEAGHHYLKRH
jgi:hypothetical protein